MHRYRLWYQGQYCSNVLVSVKVNRYLKCGNTAIISMFKLYLKFKFFCLFYFLSLIHLHLLFIKGKAVFQFIALSCVEVSVLVLSMSKYLDPNIGTVSV